MHSSDVFDLIINASWNALNIKVLWLVNQITSKLC